MILVKNKKIRQIFGFLECFNILHFKLFLKRKANFGIFPGIIFRNYMSLVKKDKWICKDIFEIFPELVEKPVVVQLKHMSGQGIFAPIDELSYLAIITKYVNPKAVFEIGTFRGRTALNFALNTSNECVIYTMDLPHQNRGEFDDYGQADISIIENSLTGIDYKDSDVANKITQIFGNSIKFDFSKYHNTIDLVFIDGAHFYDAVCKDIENGLKMLKRGGVMIMHDFANYGDYNDVTRAALDLLPHDKLFQINNTQLAIYLH